MTHLSDEQIENDFAQIRGEFQRRNNEIGLEILDHETKRSLVTQL